MEQRGGDTVRREALVLETMTQGGGEYVVDANIRYLQSGQCEGIVRVLCGTITQNRISNTEGSLLALSPCPSPTACILSNTPHYNSQLFTSLRVSRDRSFGCTTIIVSPIFSSPLSSPFTPHDCRVSASATGRPGGRGTTRAVHTLQRVRGYRPREVCTACRIASHCIASDLC